MNTAYRAITIIALGLIAVIGVVMWLWYRTPASNLEMWWNNHLTPIQHSENGIPSYCNAWNSTDPTVTAFHRLIFLHHDEIWEEVKAAASVETPPSPFYLESGWNPMWLRYQGSWTPMAEKLPTLKRIGALFPDIPNLYVSLGHPGMSIYDHRGSSRGFYRYHYGLQIPATEAELQIEGYTVPWKEREGGIWDCTRSHSAWNHSTEPQIVLFADILRELPLPYHLGSKIISLLLQRTAHVHNRKSILCSARTERAE